MANRHNSLERIVHRASEEIHASRMIAKETSFSEGINAFRAKLDIQVMNHNGYQESDAVKARLLRKHEAVLQYLENRFGDYYASYDYDAPLPPIASDRSNKIWMCWWQGLDSAPEIVKACVESVRRNAGGREVIIITDKSIHNFLTGFEICIRKVFSRAPTFLIYFDWIYLQSMVECGLIRLSIVADR